MQIKEWFDFRPFAEKKVHWENIRKASLVTAMKPKQLKKQKKARDWCANRFQRMGFEHYF